MRNYIQFVDYCRKHDIDFQRVDHKENSESITGVFIIKHGLTRSAILRLGTIGKLILMNKNTSRGIIWSYFISITDKKRYKDQDMPKLESFC